LSNYVYGSMPNRTMLGYSIVSSIPALGVATLDEATFMDFLKNIFHATPIENDCVAVFRWSVASGLYYYCRNNTYRLRKQAVATQSGAVAPIMNFDQYDALSLIRDLSAEQPFNIVHQPQETGTGTHQRDQTRRRFVETATVSAISQKRDVYGNPRIAGILILPDYHQIWGQPVDLRAVKETIQTLENKNQKVIFVFPPGTDVPMELQSSIYVEQFDSPDVHEFESLIFNWLREQADLENETTRTEYFERHNIRLEEHLNLVSPQDLARIEGYLDQEEMEDGERGARIWTPQAVGRAVTNLSQAVTGLGWEESKHTLVRTYQSSGRLLVTDVQQSKITYLNSHPALEVYHPSDLPGFDDIGGYQALKDYISRHMAMFRTENKQRVRDLRLPFFKGALLLGVPGTGKSLFAKATGHESQLLVCGLDLGNVMNKYVGGSEANIRQVIDIMRKAAGDDGLVVFMDEIEKQLAGSANAGASDAGATSRVHRAFLTWLQERKEPVIIFMTANNIDQVPPEFFRPGRIDAVFFFDLPGPQARTSILRVHLEKFSQVPQEVNIEQVAQNELARFTGAEIEQLVKECMTAHLHGEAPVITDDVIHNLVPTIKLQADTHQLTIQRLRERASEFRMADEEPFDMIAASGDGSVSSLRRAQTFDPESEIEL
jgi:SpoVK/Ycf46/Vps4 family AAA+-type ATPase